MSRCLSKVLPSLIFFAGDLRRQVSGFVELRPSNLCRSDESARAHDDTHTPHQYHDDHRPRVCAVPCDGDIPLVRRHESSSEGIGAEEKGRESKTPSTVPKSRRNQACDRSASVRLRADFIFRARRLPSRTCPSMKRREVPNHSASSFGLSGRFGISSVIGLFQKASLTCGHRCRMFALACSRQPISGVGLLPRMSWGRG